MKKLMIAAGFGLMFTILSVMPAKADGPRNDNRYGYHDRDRGYDRREMRDDRRNDRRDGARGERFDRQQNYHQDGRGRR